MNYKRLFIPNSIVFLTFITSKRRNILIDNIKLLRNAFKIAMSKYTFDIIAINVLKNHVHMLIKPKDINTYPLIIKTIKSEFSKSIDINKIQNYAPSKSRIKKDEKDIWQRRYWEHSIISEEDLYKHIDYIHYNSFKHYAIAPKEWQYSTFMKFVKNDYYELNWCNFENKYKIDELNYE